MKLIKKFLIVILIMFLCYSSSVKAEDINDLTYDNYSPATVSCGEGLMDNIPTLIPKVISVVYIVIQIAVPVVLVVIGSLDLLKAISSQKEEDIKKGQKIFIKRLIAAILVFFTFVVVKFVISIVADGNSNKILDCAQCLIENKCS